MSRIIAASVMALTLGAGAIGAAGQSSVVDPAKKTGEVTKQAVTETGKATKKSITNTKKAVTHEARAKCVDGTRQHAKTQKAANAGCSKHGGVAR
jgi:hypothetical protein